MKSIGIFIFDGIQTLDLFGPIELLGGFFDHFEITLIAEEAREVTTRHGQKILPDKTIKDPAAYDILLIPGGDAALEVAARQDTMDWLKTTAKGAKYVLTVCTGSILLAMTGLLDGRQATTNKQDFQATTPREPNVQWVAKARWLQDGKFFTSSGVSAGMDMSLAFAAQLLGQKAAHEMADGTEYQWHSDPQWDPFAQKAGLL